MDAPNPHNIAAMKRALRRLQAAFDDAIANACPSLPEPGGRADLLGSTAMDWISS